MQLHGEVWMPWKECSVMEERMRFVLRRLDGESMSDLCREFGISRILRPASFISPNWKN